jgi:hypothetical protein
MKTFAVACCLDGVFFVWNWDDCGWVSVCENWAETLPRASRMPLGKAQTLLARLARQFPCCPSFLIA